MGLKNDNNEKITNLFEIGENKWFPRFISVINALAYAFIVLIVTYVDRNYDNVVYGIREYAWGNWVAFISIPVFLSTYLSTKYIKSPLRKAFAIVVLFVVIIIFLSYTNFYKGSQGRIEIPNMALLSFLIFTVAAVSLIIYMHYREIDLSYIKDSSISANAKLERLKFEYSTYFKILMTIIATFLAAFYAMYLNLQKVIENFTGGIDTATTLVFNNMLLAMYVFSAFIIILIIQILMLIFYMAHHLIDIKTDPKS
ncbi:MAG: hypothetical protein GX638_10600 [Crenarchaeota archaeon]|nr:hypothetical protein [Thermoproteota archaeon]